MFATEGASVQPEQSDPTSVPGSQGGKIGLKPPGRQRGDGDGRRVCRLYPQIGPRGEMMARRVWLWVETPPGLHCPWSSCYRSVSLPDRSWGVGEANLFSRPPPLITIKNIFVMRRPLLSLQLLRVMERFQSSEDKSQALGCLPGRIILHQVEFCSNYLQNSWTAG